MLIRTFKISRGETALVARIPGGNSLNPNFLNKLRLDFEKFLERVEKEKPDWIVLDLTKLNLSARLMGILVKVWQDLTEMDPHYAGRDPFLGPRVGTLLPKDQKERENMLRYLQTTPLEETKVHLRRDG